jgi:hypothetical protein
VRSRILIAGLALAAGVGSAEGADLKRVPRTLTKQPAYTGTPGYALLVFGANAGRRCWLVLDGNTLYVDKNGNGDLTEPGEKVAPASDPSVEEDATLRHTTVEFDVGDLPALGTGPGYGGMFVLREQVQPKPGAPAGVKAREVFRIDITLRPDVDQAAFPALAAKPEEASVVHLDGPLVAMVAAGCEGPIPVLDAAEEGQELTIQIGTQGLGAGTWAPLGYGLVPETVKPVLEITFPPAQAGGPAVVEKFTLDDRC